MPEREILINQLFAGRYLSEGGNIGHEVINLFQSDSGARYLYITPSGVVRGHAVSDVVFVRNVQARKTVEVIAVGRGLSEVPDGEVSAIEYGGVSMDRIFGGNTYHGGRDIFSGNVTYRAEELLVPAGDTRLLLTIDDGFDLSRWGSSVRLDSTRNVIVPQGMRMYYSEGNDPVAHGQLRALLDDGDLWKKADSSGKLVVDGSAAGGGATFLEIIGKEDDELAFSNLLAHYFDFNHVTFQDFARDEELLGIEGMEPDFEIIRESNHNIDLWVESESRVIVIENKIRSGVNGLDGLGGSQLDEYREKASEYAAAQGKQTHFYLFAPDYSNIDLRRFDPDGVYRLVPYSKIYAFFARNAVAYLADRHFPDFLWGLKRHSMTMSELNFQTMRERFMRKIAQAQE